MRSFLPVTLFLFSAPLFAWTPATLERMATKSVDLAPPDLRQLVQRYNGDFQRGLTYSPTEESRHVFIVESRRGALRSLLHDEVRGAIAAIRKQEPMSGVVERLGRVAHLVGDVNNPFNVASSAPRLTDSRSDFEGYMEQKQSRFPTVFYGLQRDFRLESYFDAALIRAASFYPLLDEEYFRFGSRRTAADFDERSTAFGVAAVSYSHSVTDIVNVYYYIWKEGGGDVRSASALEHGNLLLNQ